MARKIDLTKTDRTATRPTQQGEVPSRSHRHRHWVWPLGVAVAGLGSMAAFMLRGCWHASMSWPIRVDDDYSYQVCTACGIKRLYDVQSFHAYGPYGYELHELIARDRTARMRRRKQQDEAQARVPAPAPRQKAR